MPDDKKASAPATATASDEPESSSPKPMAGNWAEAGEKVGKTWDQEGAKGSDAPEQSAEEMMERMREGYGTGKDGADPAADAAGSTPEGPLD